MSKRYEHMYCKIVVLIHNSNNSLKLLALKRYNYLFKNTDIVGDIDRMDVKKETTDFIDTYSRMIPTITINCV